MHQTIRRAGQLDKLCNKIMATDIYEIAELEDLKVIETTSEANGYPRNLKKALIGFENFEQAEQLAEKYDLSIEIFKKRDGWQLWHREGKAWGPIEPSEEDYGDDYMTFSNEDYEYFYENEVNPFISEFDNFEAVQDFLDKKRKIYNAIEDLDDNEMVLTCQGEYCEVIPKKTMIHSYDSKTFAIGLIQWNI